MTISPTNPEDDLRAELDRLDRELEVLRSRLRDEQGALLEAQARCRALDAKLHDHEAHTHDASGACSLRRVPRTSRLESTRLGSRGEHVTLRPIAGATVTVLPRARANAAPAAPEGPDAA